MPTTTEDSRIASDPPPSTETPASSHATLCYPTWRLLLLILLWGLAGLPVVYAPQYSTTWWISGGILLGLALLDAASTYWLKLPTITRKVAGSLPVGVPVKIILRIANQSKRRQRVIVHDFYPPEMVADSMPAKLTLPARRWLELEYEATANQRGTMQFTGTQIVWRSRGGLWRRNTVLGTPQTVRVYPNFRNVAKYALLATDNRISQMGIRKRRRRGEGIEFHQLREYREGDSLRQVDWKATSRARRIISREYQDERDQQIIFLLDCSRRMRSHDGELSHFDHSLNALLLLTYVAMRQGDAVGLHCFGGYDRWLKPQKGHTVMNHMLNTVFDLEPTLHTADFHKLAEEVLERQNKRSLLVVLSNVRGEDKDDLLPGLKLLSRRHLVLLANLRETALDDVLEQNIDDFDDALQWAGVTEFLAAREQAQQHLRNTGAQLLDVTPNKLPVAIVNRYLDIKQANLL